MSRLRMAVVGAGHLGKIHARILKSLPDVELVAVVDPFDSARQDIEQSLQTRTMADHRELAGLVDAVVIAAPTTLHFPIATWTLQNGIHAFVEKPLVQSSNEARQLQKLAEEHHRILQVGHVERFNAAWTASIACLLDVKRIDAGRESTFSGRSTDIGVVLDLMIHDLDLVLSVIDAEVELLDASGFALLGANEDVAEARLQFSNGSVANLRASRVSRQAIRRMQVYADHATIDLDFATGSAEMIEYSQEIRSNEFCAEDLPAKERLKIKDELFTRWLPHRHIEGQKVNAIELELMDFAKCIRGSHRPVVSGHDAIRSLEVAERILECISNRATAEQKPTILPFRKAA